MIRVEHVTKDFDAVRALHDISFNVGRGEVVGVLGPNGAGKTTLMRILTGYFPPTSGSVWIDDIDLNRRRQEAQSRIGYLPESAPLYGDLTAEEILRFGARMRSGDRASVRKAVERVISSCGLGAVVRKRTGVISKGYRQRVALASALVGEPELLVLDEPTNGLDPEQIIEIRELIRDLSGARTVLISTHILPEVSQLTDRVLILFGGRMVASGRLDHLRSAFQLTEEATLEDIYMQAIKQKKREHILAT